MRFRLDPKLLEYRYGRLSPLDMEYIPSNKTMDRYIGINGTKTDEEVSNALTHEENMLTIAGIELPDCFKGCNDYFFKAIDVAVKSGNNYERFQNVCCNDYFFKAIDVAVKSGNNYERFQNVCQLVFHTTFPNCFHLYFITCEFSKKFSALISLLTNFQVVPIGNNFLVCPIHIKHKRFTNGS
uniref:Uncharacterized protein n=1 Tax=Ascaris lumbricoides TaxID=6252 RepID=A0A0M3IGT9_ASCLU